MAHSSVRFAEPKPRRPRRGLSTFTRMIVLTALCLCGSALIASWFLPPG